MKQAWVILMLFVFGIASAQKEEQKAIDSLAAELPKIPNDTTKVGVLYTMSINALFVDTEIGKKYGQQALALAEKLGWKDGMAKALHAIGLNYQYQGDYDNAISYCNRGLASTTNPKLRSIALKDIAIIYYYNSNYTKALESCHQALKLAEARKDDRVIAAVLSNTGMIYFDLEQYKKSADCIAKAYNINVAIGNRSNMSANLMNLGNCYSVLGQYQTAISYYQKGLKIDRELGDEFSIAMNIGSIASCYFKLKQYDKAREYNNQSLQMAKKLGDERVLAFNASLAGDIDLQMAKSETASERVALLESAKKHFTIALDGHRKLNMWKEIMHDYEFLSEVATMQGNHLLALDSYRKSVVYKDSIFNADNRETIKNLEDKRAIELRDKQLQLNRLTLESKERQKWLYIFGIAGLLIIGSLIFRQSLGRKKTNEKLSLLNAELDNANKTKARFFSILNHDLRSPISNLISFLHLQKESPELLDEESTKRLEGKTISAAENLLESMEDMLLWSKGQMENFSPQPKFIAVSALFTDIQKHFSTADVNFITDNPDNIELHTDENYLKTILRNIVGNAIKALEKTPNATVVLQAGKDFITVSDNGPGGTSDKFRALYDDKEVTGIQTGLGLHLIRDLAKAINCHIAVDTKIGEGTIFKLTFQ